MSPRSFRIPHPDQWTHVARRCSVALAVTLISLTPVLLSPSVAGGDEANETFISYESNSDKLTLRADRVPLERVLAQLERDTPLQIRRGHASRYADPVSLTLSGMDLREGLAKLLGDYGWVLLRRPPAAGADPARHRAGTLIVLSKNGPRSSARRNSYSHGDEPGADAAARLKNRDYTDIVETLLRDRRFLNIIRELPVDERGAVAHSLRESVETRRFATYGGAMKILDALFALDPHGATRTLKYLVTYGNQPQRLLAARGLSRFGGEDAVLLLGAALLREDSPTRQAAAAGLARIGGAEAIGLLLEQYRNGPFEFQRMAVTAVANHGDPASQTEMAEQILQSPLPENVSAKKVLAGYLEQTEEVM